MPKSLSIFLPAGYSMAFTTDSLTSGQYVRFEPGGTRYSPSTIAISTSYTVGPFNEPRQYDFTYEGSDLTVTQSPNGVFDSTDSAALAAVFTPTEATLIEDIANDATGTQIATAVNAIIAALQTNGMVALPEE
jgi:hypothetical protein